MIRGAARKIIKTIAKNFPGVGIRVSMFRLIGLEIGEDVYIAEGLTIAEDLHHPEKIVIRNRASIAPSVILITSSHPNESALRETYGEKKGGILIEESAWIGAGAIIMPGVSIGRKAVVGAGAVVTKDVPEGGVVVGVPARVVKDSSELKGS